MEKFNIFTVEVLEVDVIDWNQVNGKYKSEYTNKLVVDAINATYFGPDLVCYSLMYGYQSDTFSFSPKDLIRFIRNNGNLAIKSPTNSLVELRNSGFNVDEIIRLKKEGVL